MQTSFCERRCDDASDTAAMSSLKVDPIKFDAVFTKKWSIPDVSGRETVRGGGLLAHFSQTMLAGYYGQSLEAS